MFACTENIPYKVHNVQWNDFKGPLGMAFWNGPGNVIASFGGLRNGKDFTDVTLVSGDCKKVETHIMVLSISSPVFQNILKGNLGELIL